MKVKHTPTSIEVAILSVQLLKGCGNIKCSNSYCASSSAFDYGGHRGEGWIPQDTVHLAKELLSSRGPSIICTPSIRHILLMWQRGVMHVVRNIDDPDTFSATIYPARPLNHLIWHVNFQDPFSSNRVFLEQYMPKLLVYNKQVLGRFFGLDALADLVVSLCHGYGSPDGVIHFLLDNCITLHDAYLNYTLFQEIILLQYDRCEDPLPILAFMNKLSDFFRSALATIVVKPSLFCSDAHVFMLLLLLFSTERYLNLNSHLLDSIANVLLALQENTSIFLRLCIKMRAFLNTLPLDTSVHILTTLVRLSNTAISNTLKGILQQKPNAPIGNPHVYNFDQPRQFTRIIGAEHCIVYPINDPIFWSENSQSKYTYDVNKLTLVDTLDFSHTLSSFCELSKLLYVSNNLTSYVFPFIAPQVLFEISYSTLEPINFEVANQLKNLLNCNQLSPQIYERISQQHQYLNTSDFRSITDALFLLLPSKLQQTVFLAGATDDLQRLDMVPIIPNDLFHNQFLSSPSYDWRIDTQCFATLFDPENYFVRTNKAYLQLPSLIPQDLRAALQDVNDDIVTASLDLDEVLLDQLLGYEISRLQQYLGPRCYHKLRKSSIPPQRKTRSFRLVEGSIISVPRNTSTMNTVTSTYNSNHERMLDMLHSAIPRHTDHNTARKVGEVEENKQTIPKLFTFCSYPFLLNPQAKLNILLYELGYMIRCSRQSPFLCINAERKTLAGDFLAYFMSFAAEELSYEWLSPVHRLLLRRPIRVQFSGETAVDFGGPSRELFNDLLPAFITDHKGYFTLNSETQYYYINWQRIRDCTSHDPYLLTMEKYALPPAQERYIYDLRNLFCQLGAMLGISLVSGATISSIFPPIFFKLLLGHSYTVITREDLRDVDEELYFSLANLWKHVHNKDSQLTTNLRESGDPSFTFVGLGAVLTEIVSEELASMNRNVSVRTIPHFSDFLSSNSFSPDSILWQLKELVRDGCYVLIFPCDIELLPVNLRTLPLFIRLKQIATIYNKKIFEFIRLGFLSMAKARSLAMFTASDLNLALTGETDLNFSLLEPFTSYENPYSSSHPNIKNFWKIVAELTQEQQRRLLRFITGSDRVPAGGVQNIGLKIIPNGDDDSRLPGAHTCFNILCLPSYSSKETLMNRLLCAIECCEGFGLM
ncbi:Ubiquitin-protein ligase E3A [Giardia lamblia P15]|uniref:HECT-type E3 ubiquitin transferase n=1 Tax=Giardia intestinalis (strain P15) TaxID=658858 RepID=E1EYA7_GIAIA|nr:Ubiquitin-protein ligase E3A [Giardia lamblia P15]